MRNGKLTTNIDDDLAYYREIKILKSALERIRDFEYGKPCCDILKGFARRALKEVKPNTPTRERDEEWTNT